MPIKRFILLGVLITAGTFCAGQTKLVPRNLTSAFRILDTDCPDSLKAEIKVTPDKELRTLSYPWGGTYKTIFEWTKRDGNSRIYRYLSKKGVSRHQDIVILSGYKQHLNHQRFDEKKLLQPYQEIERKWKKEDEVRYTTDSLAGVYIPKDLEDCFSQINSFWNDSTKLKIKILAEDDFTARLHLGFGMWMRNNWQLWGGSRLSKYFNALGIHHPDDMSGIILHSYHRHLNSKEIKLEEQIEEYKSYWKKSEEQEKERKREEFSGFKIGDTVIYHHNFGFVSPQQEEKDENETCHASGIVLAKDEERFLLTIRLIESCDKKGIISYDNVGSRVFDARTKGLVKVKKRIIKYMKKGDVDILNYENWSTKAQSDSIPPPPHIPVCVKTKSLTWADLKSMHPFDKTTKIQLVSFRTVDESAPMLNGTIDTTKFIETKTLRRKQWNGLIDVLYNYNFDPKVDKDKIVLSLMACYEPRNAVVFKNSKNEIVSYLEICFECERYEQSENLHLGDFCDGKYNLLKKYFLKRGLKYGITEHVWD